MAKQHTQGRLSAGGSDRCVLFARPGNTPIASADTPEDAAELVRRWNAWEEGGAARLVIEALAEMLNQYAETDDVGWRARMHDRAREALAAVEAAEPGAGAGREPK